MPNSGFGGVLQMYISYQEKRHIKDTAIITVSGKTFPTNIQIKCCSMDEIMSSFYSCSDERNVNFQSVNLC